MGRFMQMRVRQPWYAVRDCTLMPARVEGFARLAGRTGWVSSGQHRCSQKRMRRFQPRSAPYGVRNIEESEMALDVSPCAKMQGPADLSLKSRLSSGRMESLACAVVLALVLVAAVGLALYFSSL